MGDMLSQAEIDALLNGTPLDSSKDTRYGSDILNYQETDALGEIGNISMGTSATTLFTLLGQKVIITTPQVSVSTWEDISKEYSTSYVAVKIEYVNGLVGSNLLLIRERDVKVIADLMMGGDGNVIDGNLTDLHLSAISEAMNQMIGSSSTSMSSIFDKRIEISPPKAFVFEIDNIRQNIRIDDEKQVVKIAFKMIIGNLIDSEIMQILPISFAKKLVEELLIMNSDNGTYTQPEASGQKPQPHMEPQRQNMMPPSQSHYDQPQTQPQPRQIDYSREQNSVWSNNKSGLHGEPVNVQPAQFQSFDDSRIVLEKRNISLIMDVPLQVTVELGKTQKLIKDILGFGPGSIIELDKLAGEPVDILVNGKSIAKGEVVVIDESFGVRVTDIIHPSKRI